MIRFRFRGKSGVRRSIELRDRRLAHIVRRCQDLPGQELFQYLDESGEAHTIDSADVNEYLRSITGGDFTAKGLSRTWAGTVLAAEADATDYRFGGGSQAEHRRRHCHGRAAGWSNTPAVCRKCYVHPEVLAAYLEGVAAVPAMAAAEAEEETKLRAAEAHLLAFLRRRAR